MAVIIWFDLEGAAWVGGIVATAYLGLNMFIYVRSESYLFPYVEPSYQPNDKIVKLPLGDGTAFSTYFYKNPDAYYTILYSHGNAEDMGMILPRLKEFRDSGYAVMVYDYPGYGTSEGTPSVKGVNRAIQSCYDFMVREMKIPGERIIPYGYSLGGGPTLELALRNKVGGVILDSCFVSAFRVRTKVPIFLFDRFRNLDKISKIKAPLLIIHGTEDKKIAFWHGEELLDWAKPPKSYFFVEGAEHGNLIEKAGNEFWHTLKSFTREMEWAAKEL